MWYKSIAGSFFGLVTKHTCDRQRDGQTDGQNYDSQDRTSIASRGKNHRLSIICRGRRYCLITGKDRNGFPNFRRPGAYRFAAIGVISCFIGRGVSTSLHLLCGSKKLTFIKKFKRIT